MVNLKKYNSMTPQQKAIKQAIDILIRKYISQ